MTARGLPVEHRVMCPGCGRSVDVSMQVEGCIADRVALTSEQFDTVDALRAEMRRLSDRIERDAKASGDRLWTRAEVLAFGERVRFHRWSGDMADILDNAVPDDVPPFDKNGTGR